MKISKLLVIIRIDNVRAIFVASNVTTMSNTKHMDKNVNEYMENGVVKIILFKSAENASNIFTKKINGELHKKLSKKMVCEMLK